MAATCRSCRAPITWAMTEAGKRIPLDPDPVTAGNIVLTGDRDEETGAPIVHVIGSMAEDREDDGMRARYVSHFATCPNAATHRRSR